MGQYAKTTIAYTETSSGLEIMKKKPSGTYIVNERDHVFFVSLKTLKPHGLC